MIRYIDILKFIDYTLSSPQGALKAIKQFNVILQYYCWNIVYLMDGKHCLPFSEPQYSEEE
jgi:cbb3-type cytochrome oxidase subunit 1